MREIFRREIEALLRSVPSAVTAETRRLRAVHYEFLPWLPRSAISFRLASETEVDSPADWQYYQVSESDCAALAEPIEAHGFDRLSYHFLLVDAAAALLSIDTKSFGLPGIVGEDGFLNPVFQPEVTDVDRSFRFNYCEYVAARRLEANR